MNKKNGVRHYGCGGNIPTREYFANLMTGYNDDNTPHKDRCREERAQEIEEYNALIALAVDPPEYIAAQFSADQDMRKISKREQAAWDAYCARSERWAKAERAAHASS